MIDHAYGAVRVDESEVSYEPATLHADGLRPARYYRISDGAPVVFVNPANQDSIHPSGYFALYVGDAADYEPVAKEA